MCTWLPPRDLRDAELHPDDNDLPRPAQNLLRCLDLLLTALRTPGVHIDRETVLTGERTVALELTDSLKLTVDFGDPCLYTRQTQVYNAALAGRRDRYELLHWGKCMEGFKITTQTEQDCERLISGKVTVDELVREILACPSRKAV